MSEIEVSQGTTFDCQGLRCRRMVLKEMQQVAWVVDNENGAIALVILHEPHLAGRGLMGTLEVGNSAFMAIDLGTHSVQPLYEDHDTYGECIFLDGKVCFYDGSSLNAMIVFQGAVKANDEKLIWQTLILDHRATFGGEIDDESIRQLPGSPSGDPD